MCRKIIEDRRGRTQRMQFRSQVYSGTDLTPDAVKDNAILQDWLPKI